MTPIERAAIATGGVYFDATRNMSAEETRRLAYDAVRAVLTAIREPSAAMLEAGGAHIDHEGETAPDELAERAAACWPAMIDAMLAEGK